MTIKRKRVALFALIATLSAAAVLVIFEYRSRKHTNSVVPKREMRDVSGVSANTLPDRPTVLNTEEQQNASVAIDTPSPHSAEIEEYRSRLAKLMEDPSLREHSVRVVTRDYEEFINSLGLTARVNELLFSMLVDQFSSIDGKEYDDYNAMVLELIGADRFEQLKAYRAQLPIKQQAEASVEALKKTVPAMPPERLKSVQAAFSNLPVNSELYQRALMKNSISTEDIQGVEQSFRKSYKLALDAVPNLSPEERRAVDSWYEGQLVNVMRVLRNQQQLLRTKALGQ